MASSESNINEGATSNETTDEKNEQGQESGAASSATECEMVDFKVIFNKKKHDVTYSLNETVASLKVHIAEITGVPATMQKLMFKGLVKDDMTLRDLKVTPGSKLMLVGSTVDDVIEATKLPDKTAEVGGEEKVVTKEPFCKQERHRKVLDKFGVPDDAMPGIKSAKEELPAYPISGMINKAGGKVRLTFKLESDQLWLGTKERTEKLPMGSIKDIVSEPIEGKEEYHIMGIQLGPTEASRYWIYYVPAQYVDAIKRTIIG